MNGYGMALLNGAAAGALGFAALTTQSGWGWGLMMATVAGCNAATAVGCMIRAHFPASVEKSPGGDPAP